MAKKREFVDNKNHKIIEQYDKLTDKFENAKYIEDIDGIGYELKKLIKIDPDYLDSYYLLYEIFSERSKKKEARRVFQEAYERALGIICDRHGRWPDILKWGWIQNRHIIRILHKYAIILWTENRTEESLDILRKLLKSNLNDNGGVRFDILGIRLGLSRKEYDRKFDRGWYCDSSIFDWFDENYKKFAEEFQVPF